MKKRVLSMALALCMVLTLLSGGILAADAQPVQTDNLDNHNYLRFGNDYSSWPVMSYLTDCGDGTVERLEAQEDYVTDERVITAERYDLQGNLLSQRSIAPELAQFGGFYAGTDYNFIVFGQDNFKRDDSVEVLRVVRYTKDWKRVDSASLFGENTMSVFTTSLRMVQAGDMLYIRTSHGMYSAHQANLTFGVKISTMTVTDILSGMMPTGSGYVSHSFNQFILVDDGKILALDHGDAFPRSVVLFRYNAPAGSSKFVPGQLEGMPYVEMMALQGEAGDNNTGMAIGGFEASDTAYLAACSSVDHTRANVDLDGVRNICVLSTPKNAFTQAATELHWITHYTARDGVEISDPQLVKISGSRFLLLWTEDSMLHYVFLNADGSPASREYTDNGALSDCQPVVINGAVRWYVTHGTAPVFYEINLDAPETVRLVNGTMTITLNYGVDGVPNETITREFGEYYGDIPAPALECNEFLGWRLHDNDYWQDVPTGTRIWRTDDHTLYASYNCLEHTHDFTGKTVVVPPTCQSEGYTYTLCRIPNCCYQQSYAFVPAGAHVWDDGVVIKQPTTAAPGTLRYTCTVCGETKTESFTHRCPGAQFTDMPGDQNWAHEGIDYCVENGLMNGVSKTKF